jgi:hypothetical protein
VTVGGVAPKIFFWFREKILGAGRLAGPRLLRGFETQVTKFETEDHGIKIVILIFNGYIAIPKQNNPFWLRLAGYNRCFASQHIL